MLYLETTHMRCETTLTAVIWWLIWVLYEPQPSQRWFAAVLVALVVKSVFIYRPLYQRYPLCQCEDGCMHQRTGYSTSYLTVTACDLSLYIMLPPCDVSFAVRFMNMFTTIVFQAVSIFASTWHADMVFCAEDDDDAAAEKSGHEPVVPIVQETRRAPVQ